MDPVAPENAMTSFLLIRHAHHDLVGRAIAGRCAGIGLSSEGQRQGAALAERLTTVPISGIYSSPLERAQATANTIARRLSLNAQTCEDFSEIDFGEWQGRAFKDLDDDPRWMRFNIFRTGVVPPRGESVVRVQGRMVAALDNLRARFPDDIVAIVSHGDPIKSVLACYAGIPLDLMLRIEISPASVSVVSIGDFGPRILCVNHTGELPRLSEPLSLPTSTGGTTLRWSMSASASPPKPRKLFKPIRVRFQRQRMKSCRWI